MSANRASISFFSRIYFESPQLSLGKKFYNQCESYWSLGGKRVKIVQEKPPFHFIVKLEESSLSSKGKFKAVLIRIILGSTGVIPLVALLGKLHLRRKYHFDVEVSKTKKNPPLSEPDLAIIKETKFMLWYVQLVPQHVSIKQFIELVKLELIPNFQVNIEGQFKIDNPQDLSRFPSYVRFFCQLANENSFSLALKDPRVMQVKLIPGFDSKALEAICVSIKSNSTLKFLDLAELDLRDEGAESIATALRENQALIKLNLSHNKIGSKGLMKIAEALGVNQTLKEINLAGNTLIDNAGIAFSPVFKNNRSLISLDLSWNVIGDLGALSIGAELKENSTLEFLDLKGCRIEAKGIQAIVEELQDNQGLHFLNLSDNKIGDEGAVAVGEMLKKNKTLKTLKISHGEIGMVGKVAILEGLENNSTLTTLDISGNYLSEEDVQRVKRLKVKVVY